MAKKVETQEKPVLISLSQLYPHPDNPRVFLEDKSYHEIVEALKQDGFKPEYAGIARPFEDGYQIISGHRRRLASLEAGLESMYIWIREMDDEEAFFQLVKENMKQKELTILDLGFHLIRYEEQYEVQENNLPLTARRTLYAEKIGKAVTRQYCTRAVKAAKVFQVVRETFELNNEALEILSEKGDHLSYFDLVDECCWDKLLDLVIKEQWSSAKIQELASLLYKIKIPENQTTWLKLDVFLNKTIDDYLQNNGSSRLPEDITNWIEMAEDQMRKLSTERVIRKIDLQGNPFQEKWDLQQMFIEALAKEFVVTKSSNPRQSKLPTKSGIAAVATRLLKMVGELDAQYERWEAEQKSSIEQQQEQEKALKELNNKITRYAPVGFNALPEKILVKNDIPLVNAVIVNAIANNVSLNTILSFSDLFVQKLQDKGVLIFLGFAGDIFRIWDTLSKSKEIQYVHLLNWTIPDFVSRKKSKPPFSIDSRYAIVFSKGNCSINGEQNSSTVLGDEEAFLKHLFNLFIPIDGLVLNPWLDTNASVMVACKKTQRIGYWIENNELSFNSMSSIIENAQFFWAFDSSAWY